MSYLLAFVVASVIVFILDAPGRKRRAAEDRQAILDAIEVLQPNGSSFHISEEAERRLGRSICFGQLFVYLAEFERDGVITARWGSRDPARGWRRPRLYRLAGCPEPD